MAKIDLDSLGIEELAALRDNASDKLMEKVARGRPNSKLNWKDLPNTANRLRNRSPRRQSRRPERQTIRRMTRLKIPSQSQLSR
jgi:hypothetical protein